jgi:hypothetical protein
MGMDIDEAGHENLSLSIDNRICPMDLRRSLWTYLCYPTFLHKNRGILEDFLGGILSYNPITIFNKKGEGKHLLSRHEFPSLYYERRKDKS